MEDNWQTVLQRLTAIDEQIEGLRGHFDQQLASFNEYVRSKIAPKSRRTYSNDPEAPLKVRVVRQTTPERQKPLPFENMSATAATSFNFSSASAEETAAAAQPDPELLKRAKATADGNENAAAVVYYVFQWAAERAPGASWDELVSQYANDVRTLPLIGTALRADLSQIGEEQRKEVESQLFSNESVLYDTPTGMRGRIFRYPRSSFEQTWFDWL